MCVDFRVSHLSVQYCPSRRWDKNAHSKREEERRRSRLIVVLRYSCCCLGNRISREEKCAPISVFSRKQDIFHMITAAYVYPFGADRVCSYRRLDV